MLHNKSNKNGMFKLKLRFKTNFNWSLLNLVFDRYRWSKILNLQKCLYRTAMSFHMRKPHNVVDRAVTKWTSENGAVISTSSIYIVSDDDLPFVHILASQSLFFPCQICQTLVHREITRNLWNFLRNVQKSSNKP